jgi:hypothetical protein
MDNADRADDRIKNMIDDGMARARLALERSLPAIGVCHYCESIVGPGRTFCSKECSDDYNANVNARKRNGT